MVSVFHMVSRYWALNGDGYYRNQGNRRVPKEWEEGRNHGGWVLPGAAGNEQQPGLTGGTGSVHGEGGDRGTRERVPTSSPSSLRRGEEGRTRQPGEEGCTERKDAPASAAMTDRERTGCADCTQPRTAPRTKTQLLDSIL